MKRFSKCRVDRLPLYANALTYARALGVCPSSMTNWIVRDGLPARKTGRRGYYIEKAALAAWLRQTGRVAGRNGAK